MDNGLSQKEFLLIYNPLIDEVHQSLELNIMIS